MRNKEVIAQMLLYPPEAFVCTFTREGKTRVWDNVAAKCREKAKKIQMVGL